MQDLKLRARSQRSECTEIPQVPDSGGGFYEWQRIGKSTQPCCFEVNEGEVFAFAGIWDRWTNARGNAVETCSILTTTPNAVTAAVHDRMPVILDLDSYDLWLDPGLRNVDFVSELLKPYSARMMRSYPVSSRINHVVNYDEECFRTHRTRPNSESIVLLDGDVVHRINPTNRDHQESRRDCQTLLSVGFNLLAH